MPCFLRIFRIVLCARSWPRLASAPCIPDSPSSDSLQPCGQPKQRFRDQLKAGPEFGTRVRHFEQSVFHATSTEFPVRRSSLPAPTSCVQAFSLWPPIAGADHRSASDAGYPSVRGGPDSPRPDMRSLPADGGSSSRQSSSRETKMGPRTRSSADTMNEIRGRSQHNHLNEIEFLNTTGFGMSTSSRSILVASKPSALIRSQPLLVSTFYMRLA